MTSIKLLHNIRTLLATLCLALCLFPCLAWGEDDVDTLELFSAFQGSSSTASRSPKPLSQTAENVSIITAKEIKQLNAHTLADVLATIPGIQTDLWGSLIDAFIQSSSSQHVLVLVDGVPLNNQDNFPDVFLVPAQIIERIEIVKGAASSSWGQGLGGVINVITKSPEPDRGIGGSVSASIGSRSSADTRAELSGTTGHLGYYLSGGFLGTDGQVPHSALSSNDIYTKLTLALPDNTHLWSTFKYDRADRGTVWGAPIGWDYKEDQSNHKIYATLGMHKRLTEQLELELLGRHASRRSYILGTQITDNAISTDIKSRERVSGGSAKLVWRGNNNLLVAGTDYEHFETTSSDTFIAVDRLSRSVNRWGFYLNDTVTFGPVSFTPGARFDKTDSNGDQFSPSLGAVWQITDATLLRGYTARGYSLPSMTFDRQAEKVWTSQVGLETTAVTHLWLKGSLFRNETWNVQNLRNLDPAVAERRIAKGADLEMRTTPLYNSTLGAGYTFTDSRHASDDSQVYADPRHTVQLSLRYDDEKYRALLTGRHIMWNSVPGYNGRYGGLIWDLHLGATFYKSDYNSLELFFSGHNLFNGYQYSDELYPNNGQWYEGGVRVNF